MDWGGLALGQYFPGNTAPGHFRHQGLDPPIEEGTGSRGGGESCEPSLGATNKIRPAVGLGRPFSRSPPNAWMAVQDVPADIHQVAIDCTSQVQRLRHTGMGGRCTHTHTLNAAYGHIGRGHHRMFSGDTIWCFKCGAHGSRTKVVALRKPCIGTARANRVDGEMVPTAVGQSVNLRLLISGKHPETRPTLPPALPELQWSAAHRQARGSAVNGSYIYPPNPGIVERIRRNEAEARAAAKTLGQAADPKRRAAICGASPAPASKRLKGEGMHTTPAVDGPALPIGPTEAAPAPLRNRGQPGGPPALLQAFSSGRCRRQA